MATKVYVNLSLKAIIKTRIEILSILCGLYLAVSVSKFINMVYVAYTWWQNNYIYKSTTHTPCGGGSCCSRFFFRITIFIQQIIQN